jgi:hypothetical protein
MLAMALPALMARPRRRGSDFGARPHRVAWLLCRSSTGSVLDGVFSPLLGRMPGISPPFSS